MKILLILFLFAACKKLEPVYPHEKALIGLEHPVIYARYETLPALLRTKPAHCSNAFSYKAPDPYRLKPLMDLCGPVPQKTGNPSKDPWRLQSGLESFQWEQDLAEDEKIQIELLRSEGIPLPSTVIVSKIGTRVILQLKPTSGLPKDIIFLIVTSLFDASGKKSGSWTIPFKISG